MITVQFEFPEVKKILKMSINPRSCLKQYLPLFSAKLDIDFSLYRVVAKSKTKPSSNEVILDIPIIHSLQNISS